MWPGFGENARVLEWIFNRTSSGSDMTNARQSAIGLLPTSGSINTKCLKGFEDPATLEKVFQIDQQFWCEEVEAIRKYFDDQVNKDLPCEISDELEKLADRVNKI